MKNRNIAVLVANILAILAYFAHTIGGDVEIQTLIPMPQQTDWVNKLQIWVMARCGWHWISFDLLFTSIGLYLVNFSNFFESRKTILQLISVYYLGYCVVWTVVLVVSPQFEGNFLKLGQWMLLLVISGLSYIGSKSIQNQSE